jgi:hypothetical protein
MQPEPCHLSDFVVVDGSNIQHRVHRVVLMNRTRLFDYVNQERKQWECKLPTSAVEGWLRGVYGKSSFVCAPDIIFFLHLCWTYNTFVDSNAIDYQKVLCDSLDLDGKVPEARIGQVFWICKKHNVTIPMTYDTTLERMVVRTQIKKWMQLVSPIPQTRFRRKKENGWEPGDDCECFDDLELSWLSAVIRFVDEPHVFITLDGFDESVSFWVSNSCVREKNKLD